MWVDYKVGSPLKIILFNFFVSDWPKLISVYGWQRSWIFYGQLQLIVYLVT